ncbi:MAG TPA: hypothetical protein VG077_07080 [Verrucomicrobiae bacterium]|nr:hypothetical protein [Verrucomicrobiae bacterium]
MARIFCFVPGHLFGRLGGVDRLDLDRQKSNCLDGWQQLGRGHDLVFAWIEMSKKDALWILAGVGLLLFVKYVIFGLLKWDAIFHPARIEPSSSPFLKPLFGLFSGK